MIKSGVRIIGIDDSPFKKEERGDVLVVGAIYRGGSIFDGMLTTKVRKDGQNATDRLVQMIVDSKFARQLHYIILDGIALGGFNVVDITRLNSETGIPVLVVIRKKPNLKTIEKALSNLSGGQRRWKMILRAGEIKKIGKIYCQMSGIKIEEATELLKMTCTRSDLPEPIRAAHLIGGAVVTGQSGRSA